MSDEIERKKIHLVMQNSSVNDARYLNRGGRGLYTVQAEFIGDTSDFDLWETINKRLVGDGLDLYETASLHEEVLASVVSGHEAEKAVLNDQLRKLQDRVTELEQMVGHANRRAEIASTENARLVNENIQLSGLKSLLAELERRELTGGGNIGL